MIQDQLDRSIHIPAGPLRIISCVPSISDLLAHMNLESEVLGITKFCIHPDEWYRNKKRIGGTKNLNLEEIEKLHPTLILANKEENTKEDITSLAEKYPVYISDIETIEDCIEMIQDVGKMCAREQEATKIIAQIREKKKTWDSKKKTTKKVAYFIWKSPYMVAGGDTFINEMIREAGLLNVFENKNRYPSVSLEEILKKEVEVVLLSSEPFPFNETHMEEMRTHFAHIIKDQKLPKILIVDGEMFSWYGSKLIESFKYFDLLKKKIEHD